MPFVTTETPARKGEIEAHDEHWEARKSAEKKSSAEDKKKHRAALAELRQADQDPAIEAMGPKEFDGFFGKLQRLYQAALEKKRELDQAAKRKEWEQTPAGLKALHQRESAQKMKAQQNEMATAAYNARQTAGRRALALQMLADEQIKRKKIQLDDPRIQGVLNHSGQYTAVGPSNILEVLMGGE